MKWIPIEEGLPVIPEGKFGIRVIVATYDSCYAEICQDPSKGYEVVSMRYGKVKNRHGEWLSEDFTNWHREEDFMELCIGNSSFKYMPHFEPITHWMYMPDHPVINKCPIVPEPPPKRTLNH